MIVEEFFKMIKEVDGFSIRKEGKGAVLIPPKSKYYYMPRIVVHDLVRFEEVLHKYISAVKNTDIKSTKMDEKHDVPYFLFCLTKNLSNYDYNNFEEYVEKYTQFIEDKTFSQYNKKTEIGMIDERNSVLVKRSEEYYGAETPYVMKIIIKNSHIEYELPLIRYGIDGTEHNKTAYICMIQRKKQYGDLKPAKDIDKLINQVNKGVRSMRDVTPSMVFVLTLFIGMLQHEGIKTIIAPDFLPRRYAHFQNVTSQAQRDNIQYHATDKFLKIFLRLAEQLEGFTITALPNDIDSAMHISIPNKLRSENEFLNHIYLMGYQETLDLDMNDGR